MLKSVLFYLLLLTTTLRLADMVYILSRDSVNLPVPVLVAASAVILYGIMLILKRFIGSIRLGQLMTFFFVQSLVFVFNLLYVALNYPLQLTPAETVAVGTLLDLLINCSAVYFCRKQRRRGFVMVGGIQ